MKTNNLFFFLMSPSRSIFFIATTYWMFWINYFYFQSSCAFVKLQHKWAPKLRAHKWVQSEHFDPLSHKIFSVGLLSDALHGRRLRAVSSPFSTWKCCALVARGHLQTLSTSSVNVQSFVARIVVYALFQIVQIHSMAASFVQSVRKSRTIWDVRAL